MDTMNTLLVAGKKLFDVTNNAGGITSGELIRETGIHPQTLIDILKKRYSTRQQEIRNRYYIKPPLMALLREEIVGGIPFLQEREVWKKFQPSDDDWLRYLKLPLEITSEVAQLLGLERSAFTIVRSGNHYALEKMLSLRDEKFFRSYVLPKLRRLHNLQIDDTDHIRICSQAFVTWLTEDLGFPDFSYFFTLPEDKRYSFLEGLLAGCGYRPRGRDLVICRAEDDLEYIPQLKQLANRLGLRPSVSKDGERIYFSNDDLNRVSLIYPRHQR